MESSKLSRVYEILEEINRSRTIPTIYQPILEDGLGIACKPVIRQQRRTIRRTAQERESRSRQNKTHRVYLTVLDLDPDILIPFVIAKSSRACRSFNIPGFCRHHKKRGRILLGSDAESILEGIAERQEIKQSPYYQRLIKFLFPTPRPTTTAEGVEDSVENLAYNAAHLNAIHTIFGDHISEAVESAPIRMREKERSQTLLTTEGVRTKCPFQDFQDVIIWLDLGSARELARSLFPKIAAPLPNTPLNNCRQTLAISEQQETSTSNSETDEDNAYFTFKGASVSAIASIFNPSIYNAIESSQLRAWEKEHRFLDTTDCITMEMHRKAPHYGTLSLRIGFFIGVHIANTLYAEVNTL